MKAADGSDSLMSRIKKMILKAVEYCWIKITPVIFIHSSDLMLPGREGLTGTQIIVMSRLLDIENRNAGRKYYWHTKLPELARNIKMTEEKKRKHDENFDRFILAMKTKGYNPELSHITMAQQPILGQTDGTHRMGWLLSEKTNVFVPVQVASPLSYLWYPADGVSFFSQAGMRQEELEQIDKRYRALYHEMRRIITTVIKKSIFDENRDSLIRELEGLGKRKEIKTAYKKNDTVKMPKQLKKVVKNTKELVILEVEIEKQILYYKNRMLKSKTTDELSVRLSRTLGAGYGYIAGTVTESVMLETCLEENFTMNKYDLNGEKN